MKSLAIKEREHRKVIKEEIFRLGNRAIRQKPQSYSKKEFNRNNNIKTPRVSYPELVPIYNKVNRQPNSFRASFNANKVNSEKTFRNLMDDIDKQEKLLNSGSKNLIATKNIVSRSNTNSQDSTQTIVTDTSNIQKSKLSGKSKPKTPPIILNEEIKLNNGNEIISSEKITNESLNVEMEDKNDKRLSEEFVNMIKLLQNALQCSSNDPSLLSSGINSRNFNSPLNYSTPNKNITKGDLSPVINNEILKTAVGQMHMVKDNVSEDQKNFISKEIICSTLLDTIMDEKLAQVRRQSQDINGNEDDDKPRKSVLDAYDEILKKSEIQKTSNKIDNIEKQLDDIVLSHQRLNPIQYLPLNKVIEIQMKPMIAGESCNVEKWRRLELTFLPINQSMVSAQVTIYPQCDKNVEEPRKYVSDFVQVYDYTGMIMIKIGIKTKKSSYSIRLSYKRVETSSKKKEKNKTLKTLDANNSSSPNKTQYCCCCCRHKNETNDGQDINNPPGGSSTQTFSKVKTTEEYTNLGTTESSTPITTIQTSTYNLESSKDLTNNHNYDDAKKKSTLEAINETTTSSNFSLVRDVKMKKKKKGKSNVNKGHKYTGSDRSKCKGEPFSFEWDMKTNVNIVLPNQFPKTMNVKETQYNINEEKVKNNCLPVEDDQTAQGIDNKLATATETLQNAKKPLSPICKKSQSPENNNLTFKKKDPPPAYNETSAQSNNQMATTREGDFLTINCDDKSMKLPCGKVYVIDSNTTTVKELLKPKNRENCREKIMNVNEQEEFGKTVTKMEKCESSLIATCDGADQLNNDLQLSTMKTEFDTEKTPMNLYESKDFTIADGPSPVSYRFTGAECQCNENDCENCWRINKTLDTTNLNRVEYIAITHLLRNVPGVCIESEENSKMKLRITIDARSLERQDIQLLTDLFDRCSSRQQRNSKTKPKFVYNLPLLSIVDRLAFENLLAKALNRPIKSFTDKIAIMDDEEIDFGLLTSDEASVLENLLAKFDQDIKMQLTTNNNETNNSLQIHMQQQSSGTTDNLTPSQKQMTLVNQRPLSIFEGDCFESSNTGGGGGGGREGRKASVDSVRQKIFDKYRALPDSTSIKAISGVKRLSVAETQEAAETATQFLENVMETIKTRNELNDGDNNETGLSPVKTPDIVRDESGYKSMSILQNGNKNVTGYGVDEFDYNAGSIKMGNATPNRITFNENSIVSRQSERVNERDKERQSLSVLEIKNYLKELESMTKNSEIKHTSFVDNDFVRQSIPLSSINNQQISDTDERDLSEERKQTTEIKGSVKQQSAFSSSIVPKTYTATSRNITLDTQKNDETASISVNSPTGDAVITSRRQLEMIEHSNENEISSKVEPTSIQADEEKFPTTTMTAVGKNTSLIQNITGENIKTDDDNNNDQVESVAKEQVVQSNNLNTNPNTYLKTSEENDIIQSTTIELESQVIESSVYKSSDFPDNFTSTTPHNREQTLNDQSKLTENIHNDSSINQQPFKQTMSPQSKTAQELASEIMPNTNNIQTNTADNRPSSSKTPIDMDTQHDLSKQQRQFKSDNDPQYISGMSVENVNIVKSNQIPNSSPNGSVKALKVDANELEVDKNLPVNTIPKTSSQKQQGGDDVPIVLQRRLFLFDFHGKRD